MTPFVTNLLGQEVLVNEDMNRGLKGRIRAVRLSGSSGYRFTVLLLEGAAAGTFLDLRIDQITIECE